jgi:hypothetical protein
MIDNFLQKERGKSLYTSNDKYCIVSSHNKTTLLFILESR